MQYLAKNNEEIAQTYQTIMGRTLVDMPFRYRLMTNPKLILVTETNLSAQAVAQLGDYLEEMFLNKWDNRFPTSMSKQLQNGWW